MSVISGDPSPAISASSLEEGLNFLFESNREIKETGILKEAHAIRALHIGEASLTSPKAVLTYLAKLNVGMREKCQQVLLHTLRGNNILVRD